MGWNGMEWDGMEMEWRQTERQKTAFEPYHLSVVLQGLKNLSFNKFYLPALGIDPWPLRQQSERLTTTPAMSNNHPMYEMELKWSQMEINGINAK